MINIRIIGGGVWGMAIASILIENNYSLDIYTKSILRSQNIISINKRSEGNENHNKLGEIQYIEVNEYNNGNDFYNKAEDVLDNKDITFIALPSQNIREACAFYYKILLSSSVIVICSKGIEKKTGMFVSEVIEEEMGNIDIENTINPLPISILSGPNFSKDVLNGIETASTLATENNDIGYTIQKLMNRDNFKLEISKDILGTQICGTMKNIYAIGAGIYCRLDKRDIPDEGNIEYSNGFAMYMTDAFNEMREILISLGGDEKTLLKYCGIGDFFLTLSSSKSRNFKLGYHGCSNSNSELAEGIMSIIGIKIRIIMHGISIEKYKILNWIISEINSITKLI